MKISKFGVVAITTITSVGLGVSVIVGNGINKYINSSAEDRLNSYVEFNRTSGSFTKLGNEKYSISGMTPNGTVMYLISNVPNDISSTNYVASFNDNSGDYSLTFASTSNGSVVQRFQGITKVTLSTSETEERTYRLYYSSEDGTTYNTSKYYEITTSSVDGEYNFTSPIHYLKIVLASSNASNLTRVKLNFSCSYSGEDAPDLDTAKNEAVQDVTEAFDTLDLDEYSSNKRVQLIDKLNATIKGIRNATSLEDITNLKNDCLNFFNSAVRAKDITKGTWFDVKSADGLYELDRDEQNRLVITYNGRPGHWVYLGTRSLSTNLNKNNYATITFSNDISETIEVCVQLTGQNDYKVDSHVFTVAGNTTKTLRLDYYQEVTNFYFFLDSCNDHTRNGHVTIIETSLGYEERPEETIPETKTVDINQGLVAGDDGSATAYTLTQEDQPNYISRVDALLLVDYHGNGDSKKYFGLHVYTGNRHASYSDSEVHAQETAIDGVAKAGSNLYIQTPIDSASKLNAGNKVYIDISYAAEGLTFKVISYTFYYSYWRETTTERVEVNAPVAIGGKWKDEGGNNYTATIPYSSFTKTGKVISMEVGFTSVNAASYGKSQIYFTGFNFTNFSSGNNNVLNIGAQMNKSDTTPRSGSVILYPTSNIDLTTGGEINIVCWWASALDITIDYVIMTTESIEAPNAVSGLEAHPIDSGVVLTWLGAEHASSYVIYNGDTLVNEVTTTYITINELVNGQTYTFKVIAKNASGSSEASEVEGTPVAGATYDTFIEGLNTNLEETLGSDNIQKIFNASSYYAAKANNYRLKKVIEKMLNGEETTIGFFGGSITVGETAQLKDEHNHAKGYAYYTYQWLKRNYDVQNKSRFVNASICGTGSEIGIVRAQKDLLDYNPDIVFIEFAGNNGTSNYHKTSYESLIRKCQALPSDPAIVLVYCVTYYTGQATGSTETYMSEIGEYYGLPMYSIHRGLATVVDHFDKERTDPIFALYSSDGTHPTDDGHQLMSKALCYFLRNQISRDTDEKNTYKTAPSVSKYDKFENLVTVDNESNNEVITSLGSFVATNTATPSTRDQSDVTAFQHGWKKTDTTVNEAMTIEVNAKNFIVIYEAGNPAVAGDPTGNIVVTYTNKNDATDTGTLTWDVSKTCNQKSSVDLADITAGGNGWQNPVGILIFDKDTASNYTITISMATNSGICTIMAFGYTR